MGLTLESLCEGLGLTWEDIQNTTASQKDINRLELRHLDAKYPRVLDPINKITGLMELSKDRLKISIEYVIALSEIMQDYNGERRKIIDVKLTKKQKKLLREIPKNFDYDNQLQIELIESITKHDLAATTDWLKMKLLNEPEYGLQNYAEAVHWSLTSENINGPCFALINKKIAYQILVPKLVEFEEMMVDLGEEYLSLPMIALTHGQTAEYTTFGKKCLNIASALDESLKKLIIRKDGEEIPFMFTASMMDAVGNLHDHYAAYPGINWRKKLDEIVESFGIEPLDMSDQCDSFLRYQTFANIIDEFESTIRKRGNDFWEEIKDQLHDKKTKSGEKGSSVMAHKKNPWSLEGGLAIMGKGLAQLRYSFKTMRNYHQEGDMSRSILTRDIGDDYGKIVLGISRIMREMKNYAPNLEKINENINLNPSAATAPIMSTLKAIGIEGDMYREMQKLSQTKSIIKNQKSYIKGLEKLCDQYEIKSEDKKYLIGLVSPENNIKHIVEMGQDTIKKCRLTIDKIKLFYNMETKNGN